MLEAGLEQEIRSLLEMGISPNSTAMQAIGYKEFLSAMEGKSSPEAAADQVRQASRHYAKRQLTWFRRNKAIHWLVRKPGQTQKEIMENARQLLLNFDN